MKHIVIGTAGHVDHGKTSLVLSLTGVNTDRLKEEASRGITIELGFAPLDLHDGRRVGIIDVPGHEKFVKNMLAGATGIDIVLFVIAADEGIMPQTREHMDILRLLGVERGIVVFTKTDLVDSEWMELLREDVSEYLNSTPLSGAQIIEVSSVTGYGIDKLKMAIADLCDNVPVRPSTGICRLAVDRVFVMSGFGTVVTGTLWSGKVKQGDILELHPSGKRARVRSLQVHGENCEEAFAGQRAAICLTGIERALVERGSWLATPDKLKKNNRVDIHLELLPNSPEIKHNTRVHVHHGTDEVLARVKLLDRQTLMPNSCCYAQLELESPLTALAGDRVVLRFYSPVFTIGGGVVLDTNAIRHKRKSTKDVVVRLEALRSGDPIKMIDSSMKKNISPWRLDEIAETLQISKESAFVHVQAMLKDGRLLQLEHEYYILSSVIYDLKDKLTLWLVDYFKRHPLRHYAPKKEAAQSIFSKMDQKQLAAVFKHIESSGDFEHDDIGIRPANYTPKPSAEQIQLIKSIRAVYSDTELSPPPWSEGLISLGISSKEHAEYLQWFINLDDLIRIHDDVVYAKDALTLAERKLKEGSKNGCFSLAEARDILGTSRKFALLILDYWADIKKTYRDDEKHYWSN